ncbi:NACHT domain-containing protein [Nocardiopsis algeriensis]|uniref:Energy-coupling factor transporter ATP-binding protein EcfA2 n=1 Tax=Nocardiopsis algeriensis TaxID=1478215 RepID=A0A841IYQ8_9ACTN|nr:hypothetical protein [Nocardiopsis algeriensis]MBB6121281.1 energy-coupling factor transporter ATP-binding protein EcfA2 [Nocardiopsis algeriensis]
MARQLSYADALKLLGGSDPESANLAERLTEGSLDLLGVPDLFGLRGLLVSKGREAIEGVRDKLKGHSRLSRTERIEAAHKILVVVSFFEALEECWEEAGAPFPLKDLEITSEEQLSVFGRVLDSGSRGVPPASGPASPGSAPDADLLRMLQAFCRLVPGLAAAEAHGITDPGHPFLRRLDQGPFPSLSRRRYEENYLRLAAEVPEFGMWAHLEEHRGTREAVGTGLSGLYRRLEEIGSGRTVERRRQELAAAYQAVLRQPVLRSADVPPRLSLPSLADAYIPPRGRVAVVEHSGDAPSVEQWWERQPLVEDLQPFLAGYLVHPRTTEAPTVILGHPGAGKSKLTEMLAAQLPPADFVPIRVELRAAAPNAPIHLQIEEGLAAVLHDRVSWRELADSADGALPVVILDGFDELLQATGVDRSDYLERVQEFQHQQEAMGRPVAVVVTSRTVVADRTRFPEGTTVVRLEPFDERQVWQLLQVWNKANAAAFAASGTAPLTVDVLLRYPDLAEQPLLLLMLLIYDAADNALRRAWESLTHVELYERLLAMFAEREVNKHRSGLSREDFDEAVEEEMRRLEAAALAMFTRRRQHVSAAELEQDLAVLMPEAAVRADGADLHGRIDPAHQVLGRFFFVHESRARTGSGSSSVFEFLHATFGEYLVARAVAAALEEVAARRAAPRTRRGRGAARRVDDGYLYALTSFACLAGRQKIPEFLGQILERRCTEDPGLRDEYAELLVELFRAAPFPASGRSFSEYEPERLRTVHREANYTSNLVLLLALVRREPIDVRELYPGEEEPHQALQKTTTLWRTLTGPEWFSILSALRVRHLDGWADTGVVTVIGLEDGSPVDVGECVGFELRANTDAVPHVTDPYGVTVPFELATSRLLRSAAMRVNGTAARFCLGLLPYLRDVSADLGTWYGDPETGGSWSELHEVLLLGVGIGADGPRRLDAYRRLLGTSALGRLELYALGRAALEFTDGRTGQDVRVRTAELVDGYLARVREVVHGPRLSPDAVEPVLRMLEPYVDGRELRRVRELVAAADGAGTAGTHWDGLPDIGEWTSGGTGEEDRSRFPHHRLDL